MSTQKHAILISISLILVSAPAFPGDLNPDGPPTSTSGYSLEDIWKRLQDLTTGVPSPQFVEPSDLPENTGHTLNGVMSIAPEPDNSSGAEPTEVARGTTFWGLKEEAWGPQTGTATTAPVPKTGQKNCWDNTGGEISCIGTGQDGDYQSGVTWPNPRFTDNNDGTVTDNLTGLMWLKDSNCKDLVGGIDKNRNDSTYDPGQLKWSEAVAWCNNLEDGFCGLTDSSNAGEWRLPNDEELMSLTHHGYYNPAIPNTAGTGKWGDNDPFTNIRSYHYWSSTSHARFSNSAWNVFMNGGFVGYNYKTYTFYVWPVRGGQ